MNRAGESKTSFGGGRLGTTHKMSRRILVDSIEYWTQTFKIDGFRFDMMGDHDAEAIEQAHQKAAALNPNILILGEGWSTYAGDDFDARQSADQQWVKDYRGVGVFSDEIRNELKSGFGSEGQPMFLTGGARNITKIFDNIKAQPQNFYADNPSDVVSYIEAHDNLTLHDVIAQSIRKDPGLEANQKEILQRQRLGNFMILTSQGTAFLHAGQEYGKTRQVIHEDYQGAQGVCPNNSDQPLHKSTCMVNQDGTPFTYPYFIHDAYNSSDLINHFDWAKVEDGTRYPEHVKTKNYTQGLIALRKAVDGFHFANRSDVDANVKQITLQSQANEDLILAYQVQNGAERYYVLINADNKTREFKMDSQTQALIAQGDVLVDKNQAGVQKIDNPEGFTSQGTLEVDALTGIVIKVSQEIIEGHEFRKNDQSRINEGSIFHAWNWSFEAIENNLEDIQKAGFTAVQTSPVQPSKEMAENGSQWWLLYQPIDFKIGNQLGTKAEFESMTAKAKSLGIDVVVDVVLNHMANQGGGDLACIPSDKIAPELQNPDFWHAPECVGDNEWNDRNAITQKGIGLPDLNTANPDLQAYISSFLADLVASGATGIRFDAAKHIELPNDSATQSDFWFNILKALPEDVYTYAEVLQDSVDEMSRYSEYMDVTGSNYGHTLRNALTTKNTQGLVDYRAANLPALDIATWVESHDTYANDHEESTHLSDEQIRLGWAILGSRTSNTPVFFNRPAGEGKFAEALGDAGSDVWKHPEIVAINHFHNAMQGMPEFISLPTSQSIAISRGSQGLVLINLSDASLSLDASVNLADGHYVDTVYEKDGFDVRNGKIQGTIPARGIRILQTNPKLPHINIQGMDEFVGTTEVRIQVEQASTAKYRVNEGSWQSFDTKTAFTIGEGSLPLTQFDIEVETENEFGKQNVTRSFTKVIEDEAITVYFEKPADWNAVNIYVYDDTNGFKELAAWPGVAMTHKEDSWYSFKLPNDYKQAKVLFNDANKQWPNSGENVSVNKTSWIKNGENYKTNPNLDLSQLNPLLKTIQDNYGRISNRSKEGLEASYLEVIKTMNTWLKQSDVDQSFENLTTSYSNVIYLNVEQAIDEQIQNLESYEKIAKELEDLKTLWASAKTKEDAKKIIDALQELQKIVDDSKETGPGEPGTDPGTDPGTEPGTDPGTEPGTDPGTEPGTEPGTDPGTNPGTDPGTEPGTDPGTNPGTDPGTNPGTNLETKSETNSGSTPEEKQGEVLVEENVDLPATGLSNNLLIIASLAIGLGVGMLLIKKKKQIH